MGRQDPELVEMEGVLIRAIRLVTAADPPQATVPADGLEAEGMRSLLDKTAHLARRARRSLEAKVH